MLLCWVGGFIAFINNLPNSISAIKTDAVIVLTGGSSRVAEGFKILEQKLANILFISGVGQDVKVNELLTLYKQDPTSKVEIGKKALNTTGNALEAKDWIDKNNIRSIRLVTSNYHLPRSLLEFHKTMPNLTIIPHPVVPPIMQKSYWWLNPKLDIMLFNEYNHYLISAIL